ncbi:MAG: hypothetical protein MPJ52_03010 [Alphaproteobacteria bacterium]|nr:hypothetical protein [Alphaproteobacteria bacterium]
MNLSEDEALAASESLFADLAHALGVGKLPSADGVARLRFEGDIEVELQGSAPGWFYVLYEAGFSGDFDAHHLLEASLRDERMSGLSFASDGEGVILLMSCLPLGGLRVESVVSVLEYFVVVAALIHESGLAVFLASADADAEDLPTKETAPRGLRI